MLGLSLGPVTGKLVAEVLSDEKPSIDIGLLRPERYDRASGGARYRPPA
jgi:glycine/D-amino acid oxidase-like deaminating enzyme